MYYSDAEKLMVATYLADHAHAGQTDKGGHDYFEHACRICSKFKHNDLKIVSMLHDTVEDTYVTLEMIESLFGKMIADAVDLLTRREDDSYMGYIARMCESTPDGLVTDIARRIECSHQLARLVKIADLQDNMDLGRLKEITEEDLNRVKKYEKARQRLLKAQEEVKTIYYFSN